MADYTIKEIPNEDYEMLRIHCIKNNITVADVIRKLISEFVRKK